MRQISRSQAGLLRTERLVPSWVKQVIETISAQGALAVIVGGAVRNICMGQAVDEWDLATSAKPDDVMRWFPKVIPTGIRHGTVTVLHQGQAVEITTFRSEGPYLDGRRPSSVAFHDDVTVDLSRRDFTINAMAVDLAGRRFIDPFGGMLDMAAKRLKCVGIAEERFHEDGLRVLRAVRFMAYLGFHLDPELRAAIPISLEVFEKVAIERKRDEIFKTLDRSSQLGPALFVLADTGLLALLAPELYVTPDMTAVMERLPRHLGWLRLAAWCIAANVAPEMAEKLLLRWRSSTKEASTLRLSIEAYLWFGPKIRPRRDIRRWLAEFGASTCRQSAMLLRVFQPEVFRRLPELVHSMRQAPHTFRDLALSGVALQSLGIKGREVGQILAQLLHFVLERPSRNRYDFLLEEARRIKDNV